MSGEIALYDVTERAARWLGLPTEVVGRMPMALQESAARERGWDGVPPPDWLLGAISATEIGSAGEAVRLWRLLYLLAPFVSIPPVSAAE